MAIPIVGAAIPFMFEHLPDMFSLFGLGNSLKTILDSSTTNEGILKGIKELAPKFMPMLESIGAAMFPKADKAIHAIGGIIASFDQNRVRWLQQSVNTLLPDEDDIAVDGIFGPQSLAAVEKCQALLGLKVDGLPGKITQLAIDGALNLLFSSQKKVPTAITQKLLDVASSMPKDTKDKSVGPEVLLSPAIMDEVSRAGGMNTQGARGQRSGADY